MTPHALSFTYTAELAAFTAELAAARLCIADLCRDDNILPKARCFNKPLVKGPLTGSLGDHLTHQPSLHSHSTTLTVSSR
jgi:hypothetical protein